MNHASLLVPGLLVALTLTACGPSATGTPTPAADAGDAADGSATLDGGGGNDASDAATQPKPWIVDVGTLVVNQVAALDDGAVLTTSTPDEDTGLTFQRRGKDGALVWSRAPITSGATTVYALAADHATGDTTMLVHFGGAFSLDGKTFTRSGIEGGYAVLRLAGADGKLVWGTPLNTSSAAVAAFTETIAVAKDGTVALVGNASLQQTFGAQSVIDGFALVLRSSDGVPTASTSFTRAAQTFYPPYPSAVAIDGAGQIWVTGRFSGTADFGATELVASGPNDGFVARLGSDLAVLGVNAVATTGDDRVAAIVSDRNGHLFVRGSLGASGTVGGGVLPAGEWIASFDEVGAHRWSKPVSDLGSVGAARLSVAPASSIDVAGAAGAGVALDASGAIVRTYPAIASVQILAVAGAKSGRYLGGYVESDVTVFGSALKGPAATLAFVP